MKKHTIWAIGMLLLVTTLPAISWVSVRKSQLQFFDSPADSASVKVTANFSNTQLFDQHVDSSYEKANLAASGLDAAVFRKALVGYYNLKKTNLVSPERQIITIIDFTRKSSQKRLWIVDLASNKLLFNTLVAHGQGSGGDMATSFSNLENSHQSSLGFYITSETYFGKHGFSMKLEGMDKGFNTNARDRAVVVHGADYVSQSFINKTGRLGRSHGCPALPVELTKTIINTIKGQTCLFINGPATNYTSNYLDQEVAVSNFLSNGNTLQASI
ncbi:MAG: murein L,D-transpeptidase catalytic domain family protein [Bacteroidota bacterium]